MNAPMHNTPSHLFSISYISFVDAITFCVFLCAVDTRPYVAHIVHCQDSKIDGKTERVPLQLVHGRSDVVI